MSAQSNESFGRALYAAYNKATLDDLDAVGEFFAPDFIGHVIPYHTESHGPKGAKGFLGLFLSAFPDLHFNVEDVIADENKVVVRWSATGSHTGPLQNIPPTHKQISVAGVTIHRIVAEKVTEAWFFFDLAGLLQQLGLMPPLG